MNRRTRIRTQAVSYRAAPVAGAAGCPRPYPLTLPTHMRDCGCAPHPELGLAIVLLAALGQHRHTHCHLGHWLLRGSHQHDLDDATLIDVGIERGLPLGVHGGLLLHQRLPTLCNGPGRQGRARAPLCLKSQAFPQPSILWNLPALSPRAQVSTPQPS